VGTRINETVFKTCTIIPKAVKGFQSLLLPADEQSLLFPVEKYLTLKGKLPE